VGEGGSTQSSRERGAASGAENGITSSGQGSSRQYDRRRAETLVSVACASLNGVKIKRQAPIGPYIVDFVTFQRRLIFEVDGGQHADSEADRRRTRWLEGEGFRVLRFWNNEVLKNTSGVLETVLSAIADPSPVSPPLRGVDPPSPTRGEGKESQS
jgi:very-short-patch-repair endonuclease